MTGPARLRPDGFVERGGEVTRIEAFVDAAFAFALTMLVISVGTIPDTIPKLIEALKDTPAFALAFALIARFWYAHMTWSRRYGLDDRASVVLSLALVFLVMVYIYPLKAMCTTLFWWLSNGRLSSGFTLQNAADVRAMFVIYGIALGTMSVVLSLLYAQAWRQRDLLELSLDERTGTVAQIVIPLEMAALSLLSIVAAICLPEHGPVWLFGMPGMIYALLGFSGWLPKRIEGRMRQRAQRDARP